MPSFSLKVDKPNDHMRGKQKSVAYPKLKSELASSVHETSEMVSQEFNQEDLDKILKRNKFLLDVDKKDRRALIRVKKGQL